MYEWEGLIHYSNHSNAKDSITSFNSIQQDSILKKNLQLLKNQLYLTLLQNLTAIEINQQNDNGAYNLGPSLNININENGLRFVCSNNIIANINFKDIKDIKFKIVAIENNIQNNGSVTEFKLPIGNIILSVKNDQRYLLINITRQFITLQKLLNDEFFYVNSFRQMAMITNAMLNKPYITEEIRRHIIQAEAFTKLYNYEKAIDVNYELIAIHPTAYPNVYLNIAVLLAETNKLHSAIYNMQKFLLLNPTKEDEEFAKSKISEWEIILNN
jgi:hypothetical protein